MKAYIHNVLKNEKREITLGVGESIRFYLDDDDYIEVSENRRSIEGQLELRSHDGRMLVRPVVSNVIEVLIEERFG